MKTRIEVITLFYERSVRFGENFSMKDRNN